MTGNLCFLHVILKDIEYGAPFLDVAGLSLSERREKFPENVKDKRVHYAVID